MNPAVRRIAVLGAPGTGAAELATQLHNVLAMHAELRITAPETPDAAHHFALLMGLTPPPPGTPGCEHAAQQDADTRLRQQLDAQGLPYRVLYGQGPERLTQALLALGLSPQGSAATQAREQAQFQLNRGRTPWSCEKCSDPDCEHRLFTGLLR